MHAVILMCNQLMNFLVGGLEIQVCFSRDYEG